MYTYFLCLTIPACLVMTLTFPLYKLLTLHVQKQRQYFQSNDGIRKLLKSHQGPIINAHKTIND